MSRLVTPASPLQSDHRIICRILEIFHSKKKAQQAKTAELENISKVFSRAGGSWSNLFQGSIDDMVLLKKVVSVAVDQGYV